MSSISESHVSGTLNEEEENPQSSPNKKPKTVNSPSPTKGKSKIEDETNINCCGICLSEEGKSIRGCIDSCDHYFCFICIMEWAKVESRCPMCKRRFAAIRRPVKAGVFATERIVNVPVRDQVYHHFANVTTGPQDSYAEIQCTVCHSNSNESLLMLCDLCDSASHTYCVGLGDTVPESDWICRDCTLFCLLKNEHAEDDKDLDADGSSTIGPNSGNQTSFWNHQNPTSAEASISILDIVRESGSHGVERSSSNQNRFPSTRVRDDGINIAAGIVEHNSQAECPVGRCRSQLAARTLQQCRNVDGRIRALRENWDKIRQGSLSFSSNSITKDGLGEVQNGTSPQRNSSSCSNPQSRPQKSSSSNIIPNISTQDIDKAWKMMNVAKSIEKKKCTSNVPCSSNALKRPLRNMKTTKESGSVRSMVLSSRIVGDKNHDGIKLENLNRDCGADKHNENRKIHMFDKEKSCSVSNLNRYPATHSIDSSKLSTSKMVQYSVQPGMYLRNCVNLPQNISHETYSINSNTNHGSSACRSTGPVAEIGYIAKQDVHVSSSCNHEEVNKLEKKSCRWEGQKR